MSTHKYFDQICVVVIIAALILTLLFMNGEALGITKIVDADSESHEDSQYFTDKDLNGNWDTSDATIIKLNGEDGTVSGNGAYMQDGNLFIVSAGDYEVSGELTDGSIIISSEENAKIRICLNNITINCSDDACIRVEEADKVFLTLAEGTENTLVSGNSYSESALEDGTDGVIFAHDDLTINGSGTLTISGGNKHGIAANDSLVLAGGTISITSESDGLHVNDRLNICNTSLTIDAGDDGLHADDSIYIESGTITITDSYEGIEATTIEIVGGDIDITCTDDGINAAGGSSSFGFGNLGGNIAGGGHFGEKTFSNDNTDNINTEENNSSGNDNSDNTTSDTSDSSTVTPSDMPSQEDGDTSMTPPNMSSQQDGDSSVTPPDMSSQQDGDTSMTPPDMDFQQDGDSSVTPPDMSSQQDGDTSMTPPDMSSQQDSDSSVTPSDISSQQSDDNSNEDTEEESSIPMVSITGGTVTITNTTGTDADGIDSNGDIIISGGELYINMTGTGSNCALDYGSESGGVCQINGGIVVAAGGSSMLEEVDTSSAQVSVTYLTDSAADGACTVTVTDADGTVLLTHDVTTAFTAVTISCPELKESETYTLSIGDNTEEITVDTMAGTYGNSSGTGGSQMGHLQRDQSKGMEPASSDSNTGDNTDKRNGQKPSQSGSSNTKSDTSSSQN